MNPARMMVIASVRKQLRRIRQAVAKITDRCSQHPETGETHECMQGEMRCAYCGVRLAPYPCHSCELGLIPEYERRRSEP